LLVAAGRYGVCVMLFNHQLMVMVMVVIVLVHRG